MAGTKVVISTFFSRKEKLIALLIAISNEDKANRRQEIRQKANLALCVIHMQKGIIDYIFAN
jgi:hypothetical protein